MDWAKLRSTQEIAQEKVNNNIKSQTERLQKLAEEAFNLVFSKWRENLSEEKIISILKEDINGTEIFIPKKVRLKTYFNEKIWPIKKTSYLV